ncbi:uncharacterized protein BT62DRAFT_898745 [Guyanagaster necrorhizus]|uniref:Zn(2)-C6 fungal-type domain-containing protein n=1 Tax=Guyanagaster necrorhizus TaxID=856835 RepID=A0A9P7VQR3_9AGAR|nr:uncharacterized protein BT62DRAFT_898745 [Guyanagaster necrorhizus MCA 3950]KAG7444970.1 hypothetical protein BT62DRAFT_898745 [Guyanagaster necrorhizus MCA 3950]
MFCCPTVRSRLIFSTGLLNLQVIPPSAVDTLPLSFYFRRDKVGCDGNRPCGVCTKKGYAPNQCVTGCGPCRRARVRCEDGAPCHRCREMALPCVDANAEARRSIQQNSFPPRSARPNGRERVKLACEACRKDNKKCDEQRPCGRCVIRKKECVMLERGPKSTKLRCEGCRKANRRCDDLRPCGPCRNANEECINTKRQGGHGHRVKQVCVSCLSERDKIRCNGERPCTHCDRKNYECIDRACKSCSSAGYPHLCSHRAEDPAGMDTGMRIQHLLILTPSPT